MKLFTLHPTAKNLLDLGSGRGILTLQAAARGMQVDAIDQDGGSAELLADIPSIAFTQADLETWRPTKMYDIIALHHVLQFIPKETAFELLENLLDHLNPGGILSLQTFTPEEVLDVPYKYTANELAPLFDGYAILQNEVVVREGRSMQGGMRSFHELHILVKKNS